MLVVMAEVMEVLTVLKARERSLAALVVLAFPAALAVVVEMLAAAVLAFPVALVAVVEMLVVVVLAFPVALVAAEAVVVHHPFVALF